MKMTCEKDVKREVKKILKTHGVWYFMPIPNGMGRAGIPDFICCVRGQFMAIETKYGGNKLSTHQRFEIFEIGKAGGCACVIDEQNLAALGSLVLTMTAKADMDAELASRTR